MKGPTGRDGPIPKQKPACATISSTSVTQTRLDRLNIESLMQLPQEFTAILIGSIFVGGSVVTSKFFPEASLLAAFFLAGLAILNIALNLLC
tara:strand:- start:43 stop:318 length:276 start_codon:yes stop_codon:yes gene_type:complete